MKLIKISDNCLINPDCISKVEFKVRKSEKVIIVTLDDEELIVDVDTMEFMASLMDAGVIGGDARTYQFWAG